MALKFQGTPRRLYAGRLVFLRVFESLSPRAGESLLEKTNQSGGYVAVAGAALAWLYLFAQSGYGKNGEYLFLGMMPVATMVAVSTIAMVIVSLATPAMPEAHLKKFFPKKG